ncbi:MAG: hypothetical protein FWE82_01480 [Defluviitaleaceae bacterium]|nr:hypothetical protein [Defluviitaleaceae bacterium]
MIAAVSVISMICGLLGFLAFDSAAAASVMLCVVGAVSVIIRFVLRKKINQKRVALIYFVSLCFVVFVIAAFTGTVERGRAESIAAFNEVDVMLEKGQADEALARLTEIRKEGGHFDDNTEIRLREYRAYNQLSNEKESVRALEKCEIFKDVRYFMALASTQLRAGKQKDALEIYKEAASLYPRYKEAQLNAGYLSFIRGEYSQAEFYLLRACIIDPKDPHSLFFLGSVKYEQEMYKEAKNYLQRANKLKIDASMKNDIQNLLDSMPEGA